MLTESPNDIGVYWFYVLRLLDYCKNKEQLQFLPQKNN